MATLVIASLLLEQEAGRLVPAWKLPEVGLLTFTLGMCWLALFAGHRVKNLHLRIEILEDRLERTMERTDAIEGDARARRSLPPL
ncbi:MAG: hypothetical protein ABL997_10770 [Planctomycetota bacterium]